MDSVQPLRIAKNTPSSSPNKMVTSRPLSEIGSTERRRNSPSYIQATKKAIVSRESSPYTENSSPPSFLKSSQRDFWSPRETMSPSRFDSENTPERGTSPPIPSPTRRPSIERLQKAGRVKTSNIFALETKDAYDPTTLPIVQRPSANRPLSDQFVNNTFTRADSMRKENNPFRSPARSGHKRSESQFDLPTLTPTKSAAGIPLPISPEKQASPSPTKSSLARNSKFGTSPASAFDPDNGTWSDDERVPTPRALHRHAKSVTFHNDPPEINEYEHPTPEPSLSVASDREGSWDSEDFEDADVSFDRGSSADPERDDSFDADLENTDKTPVVLPERWSRMSPEEACMDLVEPGDDVFDGPLVERAGGDRVASHDSLRPLPPIPNATPRKHRDSGGLASTAERAAHMARGLPSPPKRASCSKDEILNMTRQSSLTLQDRLELMGAPEAAHKSLKELVAEETVEELVVTNLDTGEKLEVHVAETTEGNGDTLADLSEFTHMPPRISRESILRKVRNAKYEYSDDDMDESELGGRDITPERPSIAVLARMDPDEPIPSREGSHAKSEHSVVYVEKTVEVERTVIVKEEPVDEDEFDMNAVPAAAPPPPHSPARFVDDERQSSVVRHNAGYSSDDDDVSRYSSLEPDAEGTMIHHREETIEQDDGKETLQDAMQLLTVKDYAEPAEHVDSTKQGDDGYLGLPTYLATDWDFGMKEYISDSPPAKTQAPSKLEEIKMPDLQPPVDFNNAYDFPRNLHADLEISPPGTPTSVIHYEDAAETADEQDVVPEEPAPRISPEVPERTATIKTGGKLKTRKSANKADFEAMAEQRRIVSSEHPVPTIPQAYLTEMVEADGVAEESSVYSSEDSTSKVDSLVEQEQEQKPDKRRKSRKSGGRLDLSLDTSAFSLGDNPGLGLDEEFEKVIENEKKTNYLMRQNTKIVVASNRNVSDSSNGTVKSNDELQQPMAASLEAQPHPGSRGTKSANSSPRKPSAEQFLKTEPWNGKMRRKSVRNASVQKNVYKSEVAPPLPGQESALGVVDEDYAAGSANLEDEVDEGVERGRLFVKVVGVKNLELPLPRNDRVYFQLTLDNGLHCVTTSNLELGKNAPIGQEFELVVLNDLEFQLTLTTKLPPPPRSPPMPPTPPSPVKSLKGQKTGAFSRFLSSPKKRAEKDRLEREAAEEEERRFREAERKQRASHTPTAWDLMHELVNGADGSFARAYVNLKAHEEFCFGRPFTVDVPCYNEWALEKDVAVVNSVRSKRGNNSVPVRKPPFVVGQLELQLLYVPKPRGATDENMPKSMSSAIREMGRASETKERVHEGHLSQQGGDCIHWRRRFFRLHNSKLTAYHEHTHQKRAVINLSKASRLVDDKSTLVSTPASSPSKGGKGRRKSAFAEEDEGYQYVEEGFRIRFANGETIDFYADSRAEKDEWMVALSDVIGKPDPVKQAAKWTDLVLARERTQNFLDSTKDAGIEVRDFTKPPPASLQKQSSLRKPVAAPRNTTKSAPNSPAKSREQRKSMTAAEILETGTLRKTPPLQARSGHRSRDAVKSMIF